MTREERIEAALATAGNDGKHCPKCGAEWKRVRGADGCIWLFCHKCSILESPMLDTYSRSVCDNASIDLRDEVIALRSQVERQDALLFECFQALKETRQGFTTCDDPDCQFCKPHRRADKVLAALEAAERERDDMESRRIVANMAASSLQEQLTSAEKRNAELVGLVRKMKEAGETMTYHQEVGCTDSWDALQPEIDAVDAPVDASVRGNKERTE